MTEEELRALRERIAALPAGGITNKTINGKKYAYLQWTENGKQRGRRVKEDEYASLAEGIAQRRRLQALLREEEAHPWGRSAPSSYSAWRTGEDLRSFILPAKDFRRRDCYAQLRSYVFGGPSDRVFILYGLRRTGKTTLIRQVLLDMDEEMLSRSVFIQVNASNTLAGINQDLKRLEKDGYRYVFLDEVTQMEDFIGGAALFSDVYAASGMKIVLSGTDSLGFVFSEDEQLYDRCVMLHTTLIPYHEFVRVLGRHGLDEYIRFGGTMSLSGVRYNADSPFSASQAADEYVDSAIARNIQHSLRYYQHGSHFRSLYELYEKQELTGAVNRIVEDINHRFTLEVLTRPFRSNDLRLSAANLRRDRKAPSDILDRVNEEKITEQLRSLLEIRNREEQTVGITDAHRREIKEYLDLMDITVDIPVVHMTDYNILDRRTVITQPGIRYAQAEALVSRLILDDAFRSFSLPERSRAVERILSEVKGRMMEDIILLETRRSRPDRQVFHLRFAVGEFDMVVFDPRQASCEIFEIKHSAEALPEQARHLLDPEKCGETAFRFGTITGKYVIYNGKAKEEGGVSWINAEDYLLSLS